MIKFPLQQLIKFIDIVLEMLEDLVVQLEKLDPAVPARLPVLLSQSVSQSVRPRTARSAKNRQRGFSKRV